MKKHGIDNFIIEVLEVCSSFDEMKRREGELIRSHNSCDPSIGYNLKDETHEGENFVSQESRDLQSAKCHLKQFLQKKDVLGVYKIKGKNPWRSEFVCRDIEFSKNFDTKDKAIEWYDKLCLYYRGFDTPINKPEKRNEYISSDIGKMVEDLEQARLRRQARYPEITSTSTGGYRCLFKAKNYGVYKTELEAAEMRDKIAIYYNEINKVIFPEKFEKYKLEEKETEAIIKFYSDPNKPLETSKYGLHNVKACSRPPNNKIYWSYRFKINGEMIAEGGFKTKESVSLARDIKFLDKVGYHQKIKLNFPIASIFLFESGHGSSIIQDLKSFQHKELNPAN